MGVLLNLEHLVLCLQVHTDADVQRLVLVGQRVVVGVLHVASCKLVPFLSVHIVLHKGRVKVVNDEVLTLQVHHGALVAFLVYQHDGTDASFLGHEGIVGTEVRGDMHDTGAILRRHVVAWNDAKGVAHRLNGGHQLLVLHTHEVGTLAASHDAPRYDLVTLLEGAKVAVLALLVEVGTDAGFGQYDGNGLPAVGVERLHGHIVNLGTYAERRVSSQRPRCRCPRQEIEGSPLAFNGNLNTPFFGGACGGLHPEQRRTRRVFHVAVAAGLVQLVARQSRTGSRRVRLYGVALVEQSLPVKLFQQPPQCLDVFVVVGDVGVVKVDEIADALRQVAPLGGELHDVLAALAIVVLGRDILCRLLVVNVGLRDTQFLLNA